MTIATGNLIRKYKIYQLIGNQTVYGNLVDDEEICQHVQLVYYGRYVNKMLSVNGAYQFDLVNISIGSNVVVVW